MNKKLVPAYLLTLVNVLGFSILMPILPFIVESYGAPKWVFGLLITLYSSFQFIGAPFLGSLSDSLGRKPILLISQTGTLLSWFVFLLALYLPNFPVLGFAFPLFIIAISRALDGITGGSTSVSNAYVADITTREEKSYVFGYLGGIAGLGMIIGPAIGGLTASSSLGYVGTILASILISIITLLTLQYWIKESLPKEKRQKRVKQSFWLNFLIYKRIKMLNPAPIIKLLFTMKFFFSVMMAAYISTISLFLIDLFQFDVKEVGYFMLSVGLFLAFNQAFVSKRVIRKIGAFPTLVLGLVLAVIGMVSITLTSNLWLFLALYYVFNLGVSLSFPTFNALISTHSDVKKQGEIMGISESINSFAMAVVPVVAASIYGVIGFQVYYLICLMPLIALFIAWSGSSKLRKASLSD
jgi:DHA1 family tetracycline resistance protein-like MFS transporter